MSGEDYDDVCPECTLDMNNHSPSCSQWEDPSDGYNTTITLQCGHTIRLNVQPPSSGPVVGGWYQCPVARGFRRHRAVSVARDHVFPDERKSVRVICAECGRDAAGDRLAAGDQCPVHPHALTYRVINGKIER